MRSVSTPNDDKESITVVTIVYNGEANIEKTIESVINQTYNDMQYVVIDGGSSDGTVDIIKRYEAHIDTWVSEPDHGIYDAMNKGIFLASGKWINFINCGDRFENNSVLEKVFQKNESKKADLLYGDAIVTSSATEKLQKALPMNKNIKRGIPFCHQSLLCRTEILRNYAFDTRYKLLADYDFALKSYLSGKKFDQLNIVIARVLDGGVSRTQMWQFFKEMRRIKLRNGLGRYNADIFFVKQIISRVLNWAGLGKAVPIYSKIKKSLAGANKEHF